jgi:hypothetical protein
MIKKTSMNIKRQNINGKKLLMTIAASTVLLGGIFALGFGDEIIAFAAKPQNNGSGKDVIALSNGYPSGEHFNLNLHGKKLLWDGDCSPGGKNVFLPEFTNLAEEAQTLQIFSNKKSSATDLVAKDPCTEEFDGDPAKVQLPFLDDEGYYVFARSVAKPNNGNNLPDGESNIILVPNPVLEVCNQDVANDPENEFGNLDSCFDENGNLVEVIAVGLVTNNGAYVIEDQQFVRYDSSTVGKGNKKAIDITGMFIWTGAVCPDSLDTNGDKVLEPIDFGLTAEQIDLIYGDGIAPLTNAEFLLFLMAEAPECEFHVEEWVFNVADLVVQSTDLQNDGNKLLKIRFYPVATTTFSP